MIYLDNAATTIDKPKSVAESMYNSMISKDYGNPSRGAYPQSLNSLKELMKVRMTISDFFGGDDPLNVVLTPNITYSLNLLIESLFNKGDHIITSISEHNSVLRPLYKFEKNGGSISFLNLDDDFNIKLDDLESLLQENTKGIVITGASNVSGKVTDLKFINEFTKIHNLILIVDGAQIAGSVEFSLKDYDNIIFAFTGHKSLHGPFGTGGFIIKGDFDFKQVFSGGSGFDSFSKTQPKTMPDLFEIGTPNITSFIGLKSAIEEINRDDFEILNELTKKLYDGIKDIPNIIMYSNLNENNAPIVSFNIKKVDASTVGEILYDKYDICSRCGSHCAPLFHKRYKTENTRIIRLSLSTFNTPEEIEATIKAIKEIAQEFK